MAFWRLFPRQIASDLRRFFGIRIADWHHGRLKSYELLELFGAVVTEDFETKTRTIRIDFPPEDGAVAKSLRGGERSLMEQMTAQTANELAVLRAAFVPDADADEYEAQLFLSPWRLRELAHEHQVEQRTHEDARTVPGGLYSLWQKPDTEAKEVI